MLNNNFNKFLIFSFKIIFHRFIFHRVVSYVFDPYIVIIRRIHGINKIYKDLHRKNYQIESWNQESELLFASLYKTFINILFYYYFNFIFYHLYVTNISKLYNKKYTLRLHKTFLITLFIF